MQPLLLVLDSNVLTSAGWWFKPDFIINELNINSAVSRPWHDEVLPLGTNVTYPMNGYAYTGGHLVFCCGMMCVAEASNSSSSSWAPT
jgi:hypothetical protein